MVSRDFQLHYGANESQIRVVYNGVDLRRFTPEGRTRYREATRDYLGVADHEVLLLIVAHNFALKGVPTAIRAVNRLRSDGCPVRLAVVGGKSITAARSLASSLGGNDGITFLGSIPDPRPYYAAADIYVQPTFYDPCSLVALEALACGLPVVTSRFNGAGELISPGVQGEILFDPADDLTLAECLQPMLDGNRRQMMGRAARRLAEEHSLERNLHEMLSIYHEIPSRRFQSRAAA